VPTSALDSEQSLERAVLESEVAQKHVRGQAIKKTIVVLKRKLVNFVL
jgi:leucyl-tRNA synthetase